MSNNSASLSARFSKLLQLLQDDLKQLLGGDLESVIAFHELSRFEKKELGRRHQDNSLQDFWRRIPPLF